MTYIGKGRGLAALAAIAIIAGACSSSATTAPSASAGASAAASSGTALAAGSFKIGYSNGGGVGNGFREEQVCTAKAQWAAYGGSSSALTVIHRNTDAAGQLADLRTLIAKGVNAIVFNPNDSKALNPALAEAKAAGIVTVAVDAFVTDPNTWNLENNQVKYAELGAKWLFDTMGGKGTVWYTRGLAGHPADTDRDTGFQTVLKQYPNIKVVPNNQGVFTGWDIATTTTLANNFIQSGQYDQVQGIWASGMAQAIVDAIKAANKPFVPIADADINGFVTQSLDPTTFPGLKAAAVSNTASVGGAGVTLALQLLNHQTVTATDPSKPNTVLLDPVMFDNQTDAGKAGLKAWQQYASGMDKWWPLTLSIGPNGMIKNPQDWTTYDPSKVISSCKGA